MKEKKELEKEIEIIRYKERYKGRKRNIVSGEEKIENINFAYIFVQLIGRTNMDLAVTITLMPVESGSSEERITLPILFANCEGLTLATAPLNMGTHLDCNLKVI